MLEEFYEGIFWEIVILSFLERILYKVESGLVEKGFIFFGVNGLYSFLLYNILIFFLLSCVYMLNGVSKVFLFK